jgi:hypothetical protein
VMPGVRQLKRALAEVLNRMNRLVLTLPFILAATLIAHGQTSRVSEIRHCTLSAAQAPAIRGIRLGMRLDELLSLFPGSRQKDKIKGALKGAKRRPSYEALRLNFSFVDYPTNALFKGVNQFDVTLLDEKVVRLWVGYEGPPWNDVNEMITRVSDVLGLPGASAWEVSNRKEDKVLKCAGFEVRVTAYGGGTCCSNIELEVPGFWREVQKRKAAEEERARREFRP